jgi:hypothetical protein
MGQADASAVAAWRDTYFSARLPAYGLIGFAEITPEQAGKVEVGLGYDPNVRAAVSVSRLSSACVPGSPTAQRRPRLCCASRHSTHVRFACMSAPASDASSAR